MAFNLLLLLTHMTLIDAMPPEMLIALALAAAFVVWTVVAVVPVVRPVRVVVVPRTPTRGRRR